jgi:2-isopropylmalate synthase
MNDEFFVVGRYHVSIRGEKETDCSNCEATVLVRKEPTGSHLYVAEGDGPIHALDGALRIGLCSVYPCLDEVVLVDYQVHIVGNGMCGSASKTRVTIKSKRRGDTWENIGEHENTITASLMALTESFREAIRRFAR